MKVDLNRIDRLRERIDLSYEEAASYLEAAGGDLVRALIMAEKDAANTRAATRAAGLHETGVRFTGGRRRRSAGYGDGPRGSRQGS